MLALTQALTGINVEENHPPELEYQMMLGNAIGVSRGTAHLFDPFDEENGDEYEGITKAEAPAKLNQRATLEHRVYTLWIETKYTKPLVAQYDKVIDTHVNSVGDLNKHLEALKAAAPGSAEAMAQATEALPKVAGFRKDCRHGCAAALYTECKKVADKALTSLTDAIAPVNKLSFRVRAEHQSVLADVSKKLAVVNEYGKTHAETPTNVALVQKNAAKAMRKLTDGLSQTVLGPTLGRTQAMSLFYPEDRTRLMATLTDASKGRNSDEDPDTQISTKAKELVKNVCELVSTRPKYEDGHDAGADVAVVLRKLISFFKNSEKANWETVVRTLETSSSAGQALSSYGELASDTSGRAEKDPSARLILALKNKLTSLEKDLPVSLRLCKLDGAKANVTALKHLLANHTKHYSEAFAQSIRDVLSSTREAGGFENKQIHREGRRQRRALVRRPHQEGGLQGDLRPLGHHRPAA